MGIRLISFVSLRATKLRRHLRPIAISAAMAGAMVTPLVFGIASTSDKTTKPPKIYRIEDVEILSSDAKTAQLFYAHIIAPGLGCERCGQMIFDSVGLPSGQQIFLSQYSRTAPNRLAAITLRVDDETAMEQWLTNHHVASQRLTGSQHALSAFDPEGHRLLFVAASAEDKVVDTRTKSIIHAGWVIKDREAMDKFYRDVLGFHLYWQGGMKDDRVDWVSMQVPDGTDWIEYMLNVPENADKHLLGVMNHIALGVPSVQEAAEQLRKNGVHLTEEPKIGRDGKWQLNLYDPDETRVELMEFTPVEKPCCSQFTGKHPGR